MPKPRTAPFRRPNARSSVLTPLLPTGDNPGNLAAYSYVPAQLAAKPALVVVLHGCTQNAAGYDHGAGWSTLAERHGFALLFPEQQRANNVNLCFNWFEPGDIARGRGEVASIRAMVAQMVVAHDIDESRIFVTGLSAGGAMTAAMLAAYPDVFAAGAVIGGLPFGVASSIPEALERMRSGGGDSDAELARRVRAASRHGGAWPRLAVWHGRADRTVDHSNADALVRQWTALHGLPSQPSRVDMSSGHPRRLWCGADGAVLVEDHLIDGMGHGTPLAAGEGDERCGAAGAFMLDVGISSSHGIARFFGILEPVAARTPAAKSDKAAAAPRRVLATVGAERAPRRLEVVGRTVRPEGGIAGSVQQIIEKALRSAGLMK